MGPGVWRSSGGPPSASPPPQLRETSASARDCRDAHRQSLPVVGAAPRVSTARRLLIAWPMRHALPARYAPHRLPTPEAPRSRWLARRIRAPGRRTPTHTRRASGGRPTTLRDGTRTARTSPASATERTHLPRAHGPTRATTWRVHARRQPAPRSAEAQSPGEARPTSWEPSPHPTPAVATGGARQASRVRRPDACSTRRPVSRVFAALWHASPATHVAAAGARQSRLTSTTAGSRAPCWRRSCPTYALPEAVPESRVSRNLPPSVAARRVQSAALPVQRERHPSSIAREGDARGR